MARYHFHVRDGEKLIKDIVGAEFPNEKAAFEHAEKAARTTACRWSEHRGQRIRGGGRTRRAAIQRALYCRNANGLEPRNQYPR
ncbi:hypothetical protein [Rhizobium sp. TH2]|uniref:DUF6894 family protein n=1 Tax=Rhizobium sp. TH2 TaxID=2775403 RepID=UPI0035BE9C6A